jgi:hypothetical protein
MASFRADPDLAHRGVGARQDGDRLLGECQKDTESMRKLAELEEMLR